MSKVILLSGSPNKTGNTVQVLQECANVIKANGVEAEVISIAGMNIKDSMNSAGGYDDGFDEIIEKIKKAEGLIIGSPVYWGTARAEMMIAIQRIAMASLKDKF
ncbi:MAG: flavodoxin family protein, partial [Fusobacterium sp.]